MLHLCETCTLSDAKEIRCFLHNDPVGKIKVCEYVSISSCTANKNVSCNADNGEHIFAQIP